MGWRKKRGKKQGRRTQQNDARDNDGKAQLELLLERGNCKMESYYAAQGIHEHRWSDDGTLVKCKDSEERMEERLKWLSSMKSVLPASFRMASDLTEDLRIQLEKELNECLEKAKQVDSSIGGVLNRLKFLPYAYQLEVDRSSIRKNPCLAALHEWFKAQTDSGFITRQETVSCVPPVVLNPQPTDRVLDMCAAPGSKTSQILERMGPSGAVIANDNNIERARMLVSQLRRIMHVHPQIIVTCCDGQFFPAGTQYDRILCDVPCTGDGTARKNVGIWKKWSQASSLSLHPLQLSIAWKGISQLLKVGGYLCYSTCSSNPIENEAVVAQLIRQSDDNLELVECTLEGFRYRPGMSSWKVFYEVSKSRSEKKDRAQPNEAQDQIERTKEEDVMEKKWDPKSLEENEILEFTQACGLRMATSYDDVPVEMQNRVRASCFPPDHVEAQGMNLHRCIRCLPHDNNTGGFFVALLRKKARLSATDDREGKSCEPDSKKQKKSKILDADGKKGQKDDFKPVDREVIQPFLEFYGLTGADFDPEQLMVRAQSDSKVIYFVPKSIKSLFDEGFQRRVSMVGTGLKAFTRSSRDGVTSYRLCQEAAKFIEPFMKKRCFSLATSDFCHCISENVSESAVFTEEFQKTLSELDIGVFVVSLRGYMDDRGDKIVASMWRCRSGRVDKMISNTDIQAIRAKLSALGLLPT